MHTSYSIMATMNEVCLWYMGIEYEWRCNLMVMQSIGSFPKHMYVVLDCERKPKKKRISVSFRWALQTSRLNPQKHKIVFQKDFWIKPFLATRIFELWDHAQRTDWKWEKKVIYPLSRDAQACKKDVSNGYQYKNWKHFKRDGMQCKTQVTNTNRTELWF